MVVPLLIYTGAFRRATGVLLAVGAHTKAARRSSRAAWSIGVVEGWSDVRSTAR